MRYTTCDKVYRGGKGWEISKMTVLPNLDEQNQMTLEKLRKRLIKLEKKIKSLEEQLIKHSHYGNQ